MSAEAGTFDAYKDALQRIETGPIPEMDPEIAELCEQATGSIESLSKLDRKGLAGLIEENPDFVPVLAAAVGLGRERLKTWLKEHFDTTGWVMLARTDAKGLVTGMDKDLDLLKQLRHQSKRSWTWADVLARVMAQQQRASRSIRAGRALEDAVEEIVGGLKLPYQTRTNFHGTGGRTAPADVAIPSSEKALMAIAIKGFDSTGSKLTDARREIEEMVTVKTPRQFVFAVVDGLGWLRRESDLKRIYQLGERQEIEGPYTQADLDRLGEDLADAARRVKLL